MKSLLMVILTLIALSVTSCGFSYVGMQRHKWEDQAIKNPPQEKVALQRFGFRND